MLDRALSGWRGGLVQFAGCWYAPGFHDSRHQRIGAVLDFSEQEARVVHTVIVNFGG